MASGMCAIVLRFGTVNLGIARKRRTRAQTRLILAVEMCARMMGAFRFLAAKQDRSIDTPIEENFAAVFAPRQPG